MPSDPPAQPSGSHVDLSPEGRERLRKRCERDLQRSDRKNVSNHEHDIGVMAKEQLALLDRLNALERVAEAYGALRDGEYKNQCAFDAGFGEVVSTAHLQRIADEALRALSAPVPGDADAKEGA